MLTLILTIGIVILVLLGYFYLRFPLELHGIDYYTNGFLIFERYPDSGGFFSIDLPNPFPFHADRIVWGASPYSFRFVGDFSYSLRSRSTAGHIYRDRWHVIYQGQVIWDSDAQNLKLLDGFATDSNHVYIGGYAHKNLDPETFELLGCGFYRDKNGVYNEFVGIGRPITEIDKDTFEVRNPRECHSEVPYTARDKNHLYRSDGVHGFRIIQ